MSFKKIKKEINTQIEVQDSTNNLGTSGGLEIVNAQKNFNKKNTNKLFGKY